LENVKYLIVTGWESGEPAQDLAREVPKLLVLCKIAFLGEVGSECRGDRACSMLQNTEAFPEKEKTEAERLLQSKCS